MVKVLWNCTVTPDFHSTTCTRIVNILPFETSFVKMFFFWNYLLEMEFSFSVVGRGSNLYLQRKAKWFGIVWCILSYGIVCLGMVWCMVAVLKCEMAAAQKKVFSHPGAWKDSEIITGRPLLVNCGAGRARTAHNKILLSFAYRRVTLGILVLEGKKYLYTLHSVLV